MSPSDRGSLLLSGGARGAFFSPQGLLGPTQPGMTRPVTSPLARKVERWIARHGREAGSSQILEAGFEWFIEESLGCVGYVDTGTAWVAAGAPVAPRGKTNTLAQSFLRAAHARGRRACFFGVEGELASELDLPRLKLGEQPEWNPQRYAQEPLGRSLREQHRRARAKGVCVRSVPLGDDARETCELGARVSTLAQRWLAGRRMEALQFVVALDEDLWRGPHQNIRSRLFVAERGPELLAAAVLLPARGNGGWYLKHLLRDPDAPNGTTELLVHELLLTLAEEGSSYATWGLAPLAGDVHPALRLARRALRPAFDFEGLTRFKAKLAPDRWTPIYLSYPTRHSLNGLGSRSALLAPGKLLTRGALGPLRALGAPTLGARTLGAWTLAARALGPSSPQDDEGAGEPWGAPELQGGGYWGAPWALYDALRAFAPEGRMRFAVTSVKRRLLTRPEAHRPVATPPRAEEPTGLPGRHGLAPSGVAPAWISL